MSVWPTHFKMTLMLNIGLQILYDYFVHLQTYLKLLIIMKHLDRETSTCFRKVMHVNVTISSNGCWRML